MSDKPESADPLSTPVPADSAEPESEDAAAEKPRPKPDSYDSPWKEFLEKYFPQTMELLFPEVHAGIDWSRGYVSLDKELVQVVRDAELGKRLADKLFKVYGRDGDEQIIYVHIEVQGGRESAFPERMFVYYSRIFDFRGGPVVSLAVLADDDPSWHPKSYEIDVLGCRLELKFPTVKLLDYNDRWEELEASSSPVAVVVMAQLKTRATRHDPRDRLRWKLRLIRRLYEKGFSRQDILELFWFIDWLMRLPEPLERRFKDEIEQYEEATKVRYVTSIERLSREEGHKEGRKEGIRQGQASLLERLLRHRFVDLPKWVFDRLEKATREELERWSERVLDARRLEDVFSSP